MAIARAMHTFTWRRRVKGPGFRWERDAAGRTLLGPPQDNLQQYEPMEEETGLFLTLSLASSADFWRSMSVLILTSCSRGTAGPSPRT
jgi:hypothetical protein